jgi:hypothetical protein
VFQGSRPYVLLILNFPFLSLIDRVFGLPSSREFNNGLNLFCLPFIIFLRINTVNFMPTILNVLLIGHDFISILLLSVWFIVCEVPLEI